MQYFYFIVYLLSLGAVLALGVKTQYLRWAPALIAIFILAWADLILTAQALSLFSAIYIKSGYVAASLAIAAIASIGLRFVALDANLRFPEFASPLPANVSRHLPLLLLGVSIMGLLAILIMAFGMLPANPDSIVYRFPRAYWYFGHGALTHFTNVADPRALYYPFDGTLLYLPLIHFQLSPLAFSLPSVVCWLATGLTTYLFARDLGGPRWVAAATAWLICFTPNILLQSLSTNDEIIAASALVAGLFFLHRWYHSRQVFDAVIGMIGISIGVGTKLHAMFYWPLLILMVLMLSVRYHAVVAEFKNWNGPSRIAALIVTAGLSGIIALSFIAYNFAATGRLMAWEFSDQVLNKPFNWHVAGQTFVLYSAQIILTPFADLHVAFSPIGRAEHYEAFNRLVAPLFSWVDNGAAYASASYRFTGINSASAVAFNEQTLFIGFTWLAAILAAVWLFGSSSNEPRITWSRFHLASLLVWLATFASSTRYIEGFAVYLSYATIVAAPTFVFAFAPVSRPRLDQLRWTLLAFVGAAHCFFAISIFLTSSPRNLIALARAPHWPASRGFLIDESVRQEVALSTNGIYNRSISWGQPFWATMYRAPNIRQFLAVDPDPIPVPLEAATDAASMQLRYSRYVLTPKAVQSHLHLFMFPQPTAYGFAVPLRIPDKASPGLTWIGDLMFSLRPEWVFAAGNGVEIRHPGRDKYLVFTYQELWDFGRELQPRIRIPAIVYGLGESDDLQFRFELKIDGKPVGITDWQQAPDADFATPGLKQGGGMLTVSVRNNNAGGTIYSTEVMLQNTKPILLGLVGK